MFQRKHYILATILAAMTLLFGVRFLWTANHEFLIYVVVSEAIDPSFIELIDKANFLTPNATEFRYTDNFEEAEELTALLPDVEDVQTSIEFATTIFDFVEQKIENKTTENRE